MGELTSAQRLYRLFLVAMISGLAGWGLKLVPAKDYQSRPFYVLAWLAASAAAYVCLRTKHKFASSVAFIAMIVFAIAFPIALFM